MSNVPTVFYDFLGPAPKASPQSELLSVIAETELTLGCPAQGGAEPSYAVSIATREANLVALGVLERESEREMRRWKAQEARRMVLMRREKQRIGSEANQTPFKSLLRPGADHGPARLAPALTNPPVDLDNLLSARERSFSLLGARSRAEIIEVADDAPKKLAMEPQGSPSVQSNANKKLKAAVQTVERVIIPKPMPYPSGQGSGSGSGSGSSGSNDVVLRGFLTGNRAGGACIVCTCHGQAFTPEQFLDHAHGACKFSHGTEVTCSVTVAISAAARE